MQGFGQEHWDSVISLSNAMFWVFIPKYYTTCLLDLSVWFHGNGWCHKDTDRLDSCNCDDKWVQTDEVAVQPLWRWAWWSNLFVAVTVASCR